MGIAATQSVRDTVDRVYRDDSRRVFATLVRLLGDFDLAEESMHEAFAAAVEKWSEDGIPANPRAWLVSAGRFKAIDVIRRRAKFDNSLAELARPPESNDPSLTDIEDVEDDRLRLVFTCCHPGLSIEAQVALTLREVCGLSTEEIASAFLTSPATIAQRIVRGKAKIRTAKIPYQVPSAVDLPERLEAVLYVIYLVFNEGYSASSGESVTRADLSGEAIRLGRVLANLLPDPEVLGLIALMLLHESRRPARTNSQGDLVLLEDQDRSLWIADYIAEGMALVERALAMEPIGAYAVQAAIAATHSAAPNAQQTDWRRIVALYDLLAGATPSPVVALNRAVAIAMRDGPEAGLAQIDSIMAKGDLAEYHLAHAARADLCRRLNRMSDAKAAYLKALSLVKQAPERRFLEKRLSECS